MSGEVANFNKHYSALIAVANCKIWWKFVNNFWSYSKKNLWLTFCGHSVLTVIISIWWQCATCTTRESTKWPLYKPRNTTIIKVDSLQLQTKHAILSLWSQTNLINNYCHAIDCMNMKPVSLNLKSLPTESFGGFSTKNTAQVKIAVW